MDIWIVTVEGESDGSCNYGGFYEPGISVFTDRAKLVSCILDLFCEELTEYTYDVDEVIEAGGAHIRDDLWIRINESVTNPKRLDGTGGYWDLPKACKELKRIPLPMCVMCTKMLQPREWRDSKLKCKKCTNMWCSKCSPTCTECEQCVQVCPQCLTTCAICGEGRFCDQCRVYCEECSEPSKSNGPVEYFSPTCYAEHFDKCTNCSIKICENTDNWCECHGLQCAKCFGERKCKRETSP